MIVSYTIAVGAARLGSIAAAVLGSRSAVHQTRFARPRWAGMILSVTFWDELTPEERRVMTGAIEEGWLNGVIGDFLGHAEHGGAVWMFSRDPEAIRALIPRFTAVVFDMIERDLIEIREPADGVWDHAPSMTEAEIHEALADPDTWIWTEGEAKRMVMLMTTDRADALLGRNVGPVPPPDDAQQR